MKLAVNVLLPPTQIVSVPDKLTVGAFDTVTVYGAETIVPQPTVTTLTLKIRVAVKVIAL